MMYDYSVRTVVKNIRYSSYLSLNASNLVLGRTQKLRTSKTSRDWVERSHRYQCHRKRGEMTITCIVIHGSRIRIY
jgi:hypothetical protein